MKPYPLVGDLREPALRAAMLRAPHLVIGQEVASGPCGIQALSPKLCPVPFLTAKIMSNIRTVQTHGASD
jgi:hypothetical protein